MAKKTKKQEQVDAVERVRGAQWELLDICFQSLKKSDTVNESLALLTMKAMEAVTKDATSSAPVARINDLEKKVAAIAQSVQSQQAFRKAMSNRVPQGRVT